MNSYTGCELQPKKYMNIEFDIIRSNYGKILNTSKFKYGQIGIYGVPILTIVLVHIFFPNVNSIVVGIGFLAVILLMRKLLEKTENQIIEEILSQSIGILKLENDEIELLPNADNNHLNPIENLTVSEININSYFGEQTGYGGRKELHYGTDNKIILSINNESKTYYVFIHDESEIEKLQALSYWCLRRNVEHKEYTKGERTYIGEKLKFKEIQELKRSISQK